MEKSILVVEDMDMTREFLTDVLTPKYKVTCAKDEKEAFIALSNGSYDLILLDGRLPELGVHDNECLSLMFKRVVVLADNLPVKCQGR